MKTSRTQYTILGMLAIKSMTGYEITKTIKSSTNYFWSESEGQLYPTLAKCVAKGLARCKEVKAAKTNRNKKQYTITSLGKKALVTWLKQEAQTAQVRNELLLKLFFGANTAPDSSVKHLNERILILNAELRTYNNIRQEIIAEHSSSSHLNYLMIAIDYGIRAAKFEISWCKDSIKLLEKLPS